ncbi:MAG: GGDEF domain-containing protein [Deltaproteobacteria bacterium]
MLQLPRRTPIEQIGGTSMLWSKRKTTDPFRSAVATADSSGVRAADPDRALDALGTLLKAYGRFAFDTEQAAISIREQCEHWAQRIVLGEPRRQNDTEGSSLLRDWPGLHRFFEDHRRAESEYVTRTLGGLRGTVLALARCLGGSAGEDRESDARVERGLESLSRSLARGDMPGVSQAADIVIETARESMSQRRSREARHVADLGERLRDLREDLSVGLKNAVVDEVTGLLGPAAYEQQLDQLCALGMLLEQRPWLAVIEVGKSGSRSAAVDDAALREVSKVVSRTFLRKEDFLARSGAKEFAVLLADMTEEQLVAAFDRLLAGMHKLAEGRRRGDAPTVSIGLACSRLDEEAASWRQRADLALARAKEDGGDRYQISR